MGRRRHKQALRPRDTHRVHGDGTLTRRQQALVNGHKMSKRKGCERFLAWIVLFIGLLGGSAAVAVYILVSAIAPLFLR